MSTGPYGKFSGMTVQRFTPAADGTTKIFSKVSQTPNAGALPEGDIFRIITNKSATVSIALGETAADANGVNAYELAPGASFVLLGPAGAGWKGDLYAKGDASAVVHTMRF